MGGIFSKTQVEIEYPDNVIGNDKMNDGQRRLKFIDECKNLNIDTNIGQHKKNIDDSPWLNLMVMIPNRLNEISCIFSHHALGFGLIETQTTVSEEEYDYLLDNNLDILYDDNIQKWNSVEELVLFVTLLKQCNSMEKNQ